MSDDIIKVYRKCGKKYSYKYRHYCTKCGKDRGYLYKKNAPELCKSCAGKLSHSNVSHKTRRRMSSAKKGVAPWNKGKKGIYSKDSIDKMSKAKSGNIPHNKNKSMSDEQRVKLSCVNRGIDVNDFDGFISSKNKIQREKFYSTNIREECFENADYTCDIYGIKGIELNAHHLDSWHDNEDKRFQLDNLVCISKEAHKTFHHLYGKKNNTREQYEEFKREVKGYMNNKQDLFLVAGCPASGKSWVCEQLTDRFNYVPYDGVNRNYHVYELLKNNDRPLLYDPTIKVSTFTKRYGHLFNIRLIVIVEDKDVIVNRMISRYGKVTNTVDGRIKRMSQLSSKCEFSGTSDEVFNYLKSVKL